MSWRRVAEMLNLKHAVELQDERSSASEHVKETERKIREQTEAVAEMTRQAKLGSYRRVRIGR